MTRRPDLYAILGVEPTATQAEISHAYRTLLRRRHPDTRPPLDETHELASGRALQQVLDAYTILKHPTRRAEYDRQVSSQMPPEIQPPRRPPNPPRTYRQPPIIAGPVHWHRPDPPPS